MCNSYYSYNSYCSLSCRYMYVYVCMYVVMQKYINIEICRRAIGNHVVDIYLYIIAIVA